MNTHGCIRINDDDIKEMQIITNKLEAADKLEKKEKLTVADDLVDPVSYSDQEEFKKGGSSGDFVDKLHTYSVEKLKEFNQYMIKLFEYEDLKAEESVLEKKIAELQGKIKEIDKKINEIN